MALWLALFLPALPLQLAARGLPASAAQQPLAVIEGPVQRPCVGFCNEVARAAGIHVGQKLPAAQALAHDLIAVDRNPDGERAALDELASWAYGFSAAVVLQSNGVLLETGASERLFGGHARLHRRITRAMQGLGYTAASGYAATPRAAWLISAARAQQIETPDACEAAALPMVLAPLPLALLNWEDTTLGTLHALGLRTLGDVLQLPRAAVTRRFGTALLEDLDRTLGRIADPQPVFAPPERFHVRIDLPVDVVDAGQLMFPANRLLRSLESFLRGRGAGTTELVFEAHHSPRRAVVLPPTRIDLRLAAPERSAFRLARLLEERLTRCQLPQPAIALTLRVEHLLPYSASNASWLPPAPNAGQGSDWLQLAETLHARLGSERVFQVQVADDHRPEHAYRVVPVAIEAVSKSAARAVAPADAAPRPLLILPQPQPLACRDDTPDFRGALMLITGPERIESGWWDFGSPTRRSVFRDYFVARNPRGQTLWIYRELAAPRGWYLHGFFA